ncbi:thiolase family protein [Candidatus Woesearchaeota archaeon]|nr:thiolase family protein [Candidatus Woesearchaeota archaeon]
MNSVVIASACRTPTGKYLKSLSPYSATDLGAIVIKEAINRSKVSLKEVDEVIMGNVLSAGLGQNPAHRASLAAGLPDKVHGFTVNKVCGSGLKSVILGVQSIMCGDNKIVVCGGMESMSNAPFLSREYRRQKKINEAMLVDSMIYDGLFDCFYNKHMGQLAERIVRKYGIAREDQDLFALASHQKAIFAIQHGLFRKEIVPVGKVNEDEGPRRDTSFEKLSALRPAFVKGGTITAGNASGLNDGASAVVLMSENEAHAKGIKPLARVTGWSVSALDPQWFSLSTVDAVNKLLKQQKMIVDDYDIIELNEAFAAQSITVMQKLKINPEKLNVHGGAIALGHPIGASGARILVTLLHSLERYRKKRGLATLCIGGGQGIAMSVERI